MNLQERFAKLQSIPDELWQRINRIGRKQQAYRAIFLGANKEYKEDAKIVLKDLQKYCWAKSIIVHDNTGKIDPIAMAVAQGRREVYERILTYLHGAEASVKNVQLEADSYEN